MLKIPTIVLLQSLLILILRGGGVVIATAKERAQRERLGDLAVFERLNGDPRKTSASIAVKKVVLVTSVNTLRKSWYVHVFECIKTRTF